MSRQPGEATDRDRARWALRDDRKLSWRAKLVWHTLHSRGEDIYPSLRTLAADCSIDRNTARRGVAELQSAGWLRVTARTARAGDADTYRYELLCPYDVGVGQPLTHPHVSPGQRGVGEDVTHPSSSVGRRGVGEDVTHRVGEDVTQGGCTAHPEDQREDQQVKTKAPARVVVGVQGEEQAARRERSDTPEIDPSEVRVLSGAELTESQTVKCPVCHEIARRPCVRREGKRKITLNGSHIARIEDAKAKREGAAAPSAGAATPVTACDSAA